MIDNLNYLETKTEKYPYIFSINVMEKIQDEYGTIDRFLNLIQREGEPDIKALKFFMTEAINDGIDIENDKTGEKRKSITSKKVGWVLTEIGFSNIGNKVTDAILSSVATDDTEKNAQTTESQK